MHIVRFSRPVVWGLLLGAVSTLSAATINIGVFNSAQVVSVGPTATTAGNPLSASNSTATNAPAGLGGQREFIVRRSGGTGRIQMDIDTTALDALSFTSSGNAVGRGLVTWDGPDTATQIFNPQSAIASEQRGQPNAFGLTGSGTTGGIDLTSGGTNNAITILAAADNVGLPVIFHFYRSAGVFATTTINVPGNTAIFDLTRHVMMFSSFTTQGVGAGETALDIFKDTKAITMQIDGRNASDAQFDDLQATYVPEPISSALVGAGLVGLGILRRRR